MLVVRANLHQGAVVAHALGSSCCCCSMPALGATDGTCFRPSFLPFFRCRLDEEGLSGSTTMQWLVLPAAQRFLAGEGKETVASVVAAAKKEKGEGLSALESCTILEGCTALTLRRAGRCLCHPALQLTVQPARHRSAASRWRVLLCMLLTCFPSLPAAKKEGQAQRQAALHERLELEGLWEGVPEWYTTAEYIKESTCSAPWLSYPASMSVELSACVLRSLHLPLGACCAKLRNSAALAIQRGIRCLQPLGAQT